jgi:hypothetical protein
MKLGEAVYKAQGGADMGGMGGGAGGAHGGHHGGSEESSGSGEGDEDVVDAEYTDESKKGKK